MNRQAKALVDPATSAPASPTDCIAAIAAGRALPVARHTVTPAFRAARRACTEEGSTLLRPSSSVPVACRENV